MPILDCSTCGGPLPADSRCCPHCHCKRPAWRRWMLLAAAALGLGAAECNSVEPVIEYGPAFPFDMATDAATPDLAPPADAAEPADAGDGGSRVDGGG